MRERRHQRVAGRRRLRRERGDDAGDAALQQRDAAPQVQPQIERHLLVARAAGVQPAPGVAEPLDEQALDEAVDVLVVAVDKRADPSGRARGSPSSAVSICSASACGSTPARAERARPRDAAGHVVFEQPAIEAEGRAELERRRVGRGVESSGPECCHVVVVAAAAGS